MFAFNKGRFDLICLTLYSKKNSMYIAKHIYCGELLFMKYGNLHTHTTFCDGKNTMESMVIKAINLGFDFIGFSGHSYLDGCDSWCMTRERFKLYINEANRLKDKYSGWINIFIGLEQDFFSEKCDYQLDYKIGAVHCFNIGGKLYPVDANQKFLKRIIDEHFDGNFLKMAENYFSLVSNVVDRTDCDIIAHFDLITKFNKLGYFYDEDSPSYLELGFMAIDKLLKTGKPFELNTGGMARGYLQRPYPNSRFVEYIKANGGKLIATSDCHDLNYLDYGFDKYSNIIDDFIIDKLNNK